MSTLSSNELAFTSWDIKEDGNDLDILKGGVSKLRVTSSGLSASQVAYDNTASGLTS